MAFEIAADVKLKRLQKGEEWKGKKMKSEERVFVGKGLYHTLRARELVQFLEDGFNAELRRAIQGLRDEYWLEKKPGDTLY